MGTAELIAIIAPVSALLLAGHVALWHRVGRLEGKLDQALNDRRNP